MRRLHRQDLMDNRLALKWTPFPHIKMMVSPGAGGLPGNPVQTPSPGPSPGPELDKLNPPITLSAPDSAQPAYSFQNLLGNFVQDVNDKTGRRGRCQSTDS